MKKKKYLGPEGFESYYSERWEDRWEMLKEALLGEPDHIELKKGLLKSYYLDSASIVPPEILDVKPGMDVLDLCAAPGGKTLQLALALKGKGRLWANDLSVKRVQRLKEVLKSHLTEQDFTPLFLTHSDGTRWGLSHVKQHDRILLDAPCSSEKHLLRSPEYLKDWSSNRIKSLSYRQAALACAAMDSLKPRGIMVYSTCALSYEENDGVISKLNKKRKDQFQVLKSKDYIGEEKEWGYHILPDKEGSGPIYYALLQKNL